MPDIRKNTRVRFAIDVAVTLSGAVSAGLIFYQEMPWQRTVLALFCVSVFLIMAFIYRDAKRFAADNPPLLLPPPRRLSSEADAKNDGGHAGSDSPYWPSRDDTPWKDH